MMHAREKTDPALDSLLRTRRFEPASAGLAERIIAAAHGRRQNAATFGAWLSELLAEVARPTPAFALAAMLLIGFVLGAMPSPVDDSDTPLQTYFEYEGASL